MPAAKHAPDAHPLVVPCTGSPRDQEPRAHSAKQKHAGCQCIAAFVCLLLLPALIGVCQCASVPGPPSLHWAPYQPPTVHTLSRRTQIRTGNPTDFVEQNQSLKSLLAAEKQRHEQSITIADKKETEFFKQITRLTTEVDALESQVLCLIRAELPATTALPVVAPLTLAQIV